MPTVIDLFAGAGGLSLGAARAGFDVAVAVELDSSAMNSHRENFPHTRHIQQDILALTGAQILQLSQLSSKDITGVIGGPPCQGFSNIGHGDVNDTRNQLFIKFFEIVNELQPVFFVAENVPGIMNSKYDAIRQEAFSKLKDYVILAPLLVNASEYGAPTTRTRYFFIGYRKHCDCISPITAKDITRNKVKSSETTNVIVAMEGLPANIRYSKTCSGLRKLDPEYTDVNVQHKQSSFFYNRVTNQIPYNVGDPVYVANYQDKHIVNGCNTTKHSAAVRYRYSKLEYNQQDTISKSKRLDPYGFCPTLRAGTGPDKGSYQAVRPIHFKYSRVITPREAARLQGFPDWYKLPNTIWHSFRQIGNSVSPIVAEQVLSAIYQKLIL